GVYFFSSRSSAAWAKKALADFRISLARRNSRFSFSNALRRSRSSVVTPGRVPLLTSDRLIQSSRVVGVQPIFGAIDSTAAHSDRYSSRCSWTRRTARSRTSGENLLFLLMAPFSQEMKPPQTRCDSPADWRNTHSRLACGGAPRHGCHERVGLVQ